MELKNIKNIGPVTLERLHTNQIYSPKDLLLRFPKKYFFYKVDNENAFSGEQICFRCVVSSRPVVIKTSRKAKAFVFYAMVNGSKVKCIIFSGDYLRFRLQMGISAICYGKYKEKEKEFSVSTIFFEDFDCRIELDYGIPDINNSTIQHAIQRVLDSGYLLEDELPKDYIDKYRLLTMNEIVRLAHFPKDISDCIKVRRRVRYEDFFSYTASLESLRLLRGFEHKSPRIYDEVRLNNYIQGLPYELTTDQKKVIEECLNDLHSSKIMNRLVQGDVGSGKSIVAFLVAAATVMAGYQASIMAPTELLARQHFMNFKLLFPELQVELLTSSCKEKEKQEILYKLLHGRIDVIIGTHALIENKVVFQRLGLVIIDEQHRFGVNQRKALIEKFKGVDALYLTATPIPRTLGLTSFGDLDLSIIRTKPAHRKEVITELLSYDQLASLGKTLNRHILRGEQIYIVVPLILENDQLDYVDIQKAFEWFSSLLPEARIELLHGKMKAKEKEEVMNSFKAHRIDCLISTTVIEVGVDVKNATVMVILDADRYGLSQIHQLRGRVGRGERQSYCYLVSRKEGVERLEILKKTTDGFVLAEEDFKLRGPGDYLGEDQSGFGSLNFDFDSKDIAIWKCALDDSKEFVARYLNGGITNKKMAAILQQISDKKTKIN